MFFYHQIIYTTDPSKLYTNYTLGIYPARDLNSRDATTTSLPQPRQL